MLRFNDVVITRETKPVRFQYILCYGSTVAYIQHIFLSNAFQYILCYGSTLQTGKFWRGFFNFNTSYVTVQPIAVHMIYAFHYTGITLKHQQFL